MIHCEHALHEVELKARDAGNPGKLLAYKGFLHGAVHIEDAVHGARGGRGRQRGPVHGLGRVMAAAAVLVRMVVVAAFVFVRVAAFRMAMRVVAVLMIMAAARVAVVMAVVIMLVAVGGVFVSGGQGGCLVTYEALRVPGTAGA